MGIIRKATRGATFFATGVPLAHKRSKKDKIVRNTERQAEAMEQMAAQTPTGPPPTDAGYVDWDAWAAANNSNPPPAPPPQQNVADELAKLTDLHQQGYLSQEEFRAAKARLLGH